MSKPHRHKGGRFLHNHSLSLVSIALLVLWITLYSQSDPDSHWGGFFGNAIADWSGSVVIIIGTKFLYEAGSAESRQIHGRKKSPLRNLLWRHSLLLFVIVTGVGWLLLYLRMNPKDKWGQVVGNIVSEWLQIGGLVFLTKSLIERGSKESR
jgi:membrane protease YdiL (CAAX protease family)